ncbi:MAG: autotransporter outer membrane beta-barrel domain-containing protein [Selenomonadaceae bacterium]|nr:autotransporter outer membrane beta-barrel domain-containing protein [Selenomonadaceae bacterium]
MFKEREAGIMRLFFAFLMFVWLATSSRFVGAEGASENTVVVNEATYSVNGEEEISYTQGTNAAGGVNSNVLMFNGDILGGIEKDGYTATKNSIVLNGGSLANVYGGRSIRDAEANSVAMYGGNIKELYGGYSSYSDSFFYGAKKNIVTVTNGSVESIYGGYSSIGGNAKDNTVIISGGNIKKIHGGYSNAGDAEKNIIEISGGTFSNDNSYTQVYGGYSASGNASDNTVNISNGDFSLSFIVGGISVVKNASNNIVNISGGNFSNTQIRGGDVAGSNYGQSSNNTVNISGGDLSGTYIYGGYVGNYNGSANDNVINISGNPILNNANISGGYAGGANTLGNTLSVRTKNIKVGTIAGFDNINFHLDSENNKSNVANGDRMLIADTANIEGAKITGYVAGDTDLKEGDTVTLLDAETLNADDNTTYTGSVAEGISFNHELNVKRDGNKILATIGEEKEKKDDPTPASGNASNNIVTVNDTTYNINDGEEINYSGSKNIYGGIAGTIDATNHIVGGNATSGDASSNTVNINSGNLSGANVYGGYASTGAASNNTINISGTSNLDNASIYGGYVSGETSSENSLMVSNDKLSPQGVTDSDIVVSYPDATDGTGAASNNTINITDAPSLTGASIYGGYAANGGATSGNTLNIRTKNISAKSIGNFDNINFYLDTDNNKSNVANGDTMLTVETADIGGATIKGIVAGDTTLTEGDTVTLLNATNSLTDNPNTKYTSSIAEGISFNRQLNVTNEGNKITATIGGIGGSGGDKEGSGTTILEQTTVIPTAPVSAPKMVTAHIDSTLNWLPSEDFAMPSSGSTEKSSGDEEAEASKELGSDVQTEKPGYEIFGNIGASSLRTNTGNGSYVDNKTNGINLGFARRFDSENGNRTYIAPLFDFGGGSYESHLASGIKGKGHTHFTTGGVIARRSLKNGTYFESSFRMGKTTMDFATDDLVQGDTHPHVAYNTSASVWAAHLNVGRRINLSPKDVLNIYGIYFHTHQGGMDAKLTTGETYQFNSVTNQRLRVGARLLKWAKPTSCFYSGVAYQWESAGAANATYKDQTTHNVGASGSSFMIELGWQVKPAATSRIALDIGAVGWLGHQRGGSAHVKFNYSF